MDNIKKGLSSIEVEERIRNGLLNYDDTPKTKSIKEIIYSNIFTYFNFLNIFLGLSVFIAGIIGGNIFKGLKNCLFMGVIIINSIISIIEEIISKKIIDKLSLLDETTTICIRDGKEVSKKINEIVKDDIIKLEMGHQILTDSEIIDGQLEVNESLITGEIDPISKKTGDVILSGSYIISGNAYAKVIHIGSENYTAKISREAKIIKESNSVIMKSFENLLKILSILIIPLGILMYITQVKSTGSINEAIFMTVASIIGMIPEGLVLLTSSVMAVSIIRLSKYHVLVQKLYSIESLARVDTICLDKTGTLTEGKMTVVDYIPYKISKEKFYDIITSYVSLSNDKNSTMDCLKNYFDVNSNYALIEELSFSSERKYSSIRIDKIGTIYLGAPDILFKDDKKVQKYLEQYQDKRLLALGLKAGKISKNINELEFLGIIILEDVIRKSAPSLISYLKKEGVKVKVISGDNVNTVCHIANEVGIKGNGINTNILNEEELKDAVKKYDIFGRVTPEQKKIIVKTLKDMGRTVAMTGDGVNDVLALREADCAITIKKGTDAAKNVSEIILFDDNFDSVKEVIKEGRRTINNIERSSSLLLVKTIYTLLLIVFSILSIDTYVFIPIQLTLITSFTIGTPSFILALEPNNDLVKGNFLLKVISKALPTAMIVVLNVILVTCFANLFNLSYEMKSTISVYLTTLVGLIYLYKICKPFTILRSILFSTMTFGFIYTIIFQYEFFNLLPLSPVSILIFLVLGIDSIYIYNILNHYISKIFNYIDKSIEVQ